MRGFVIAATIAFTLLAAAQLLRFLFGLRVTVDVITVPLWPSALAALVMGALASWGVMVLLRRAAP